LKPWRLLRFSLCRSSQRIESERFEFAIHNGLELKNRSLVFSIVQLYDEYHSTKYYFPGIAGPANIESTDGFKAYAETLDDEACISASMDKYFSVRSYV